MPKGYKTTLTEVEAAQALEGHVIEPDLTIPAAMLRHCLSRAQIYNLIRAGVLKSYRIGPRGVRITRESSDHLRQGGMNPDNATGEAA